MRSPTLLTTLATTALIIGTSECAPTGYAAATFTAQEGDAYPTLTVSGPGGPPITIAGSPYPPFLSASAIMVEGPKPPINNGGHPPISKPKGEVKQMNVADAPPPLGSGDQCQCQCPQQQN